MAARLGRHGLRHRSDPDPVMLAGEGTRPAGWPPYVGVVTRTWGHGDVRGRAVAVRSPGAGPWIARSDARGRASVACGRGRGRTGTALACLAVLDGVPVGGAVAYVREHYDARAVEAPWQRRYVGRGPTGWRLKSEEPGCCLAETGKGWGSSPSRCAQPGRKSWACPHRKPSTHLEGQPSVPDADRSPVRRSGRRGSGVRSQWQAWRRR